MIIPKYKIKSILRSNDKILMTYILEMNRNYLIMYGISNDEFRYTCRRFLSKIYMYFCHVYQALLT